MPPLRPAWAGRSLTVLCCVAKEKANGACRASRTSNTSSTGWQAARCRSSPAVCRACRGGEEEAGAIQPAAEASPRAKLQRGRSDGGGAVEASEPPHPHPAAQRVLQRPDLLPAEPAAFGRIDFVTVQFRTGIAAAAAGVDCPGIAQEAGFVAPANLPEATGPRRPGAHRPEGSCHRFDRRYRSHQS